MKKIIALILIAVAFASAKDYTKTFMDLIDNLENCELSKDTITEDFGRELFFGCNEDTVQFITHGSERMAVTSISVNTVEYYKGVKVTAYRYFVHSRNDNSGNSYKGSYNEVYRDELHVCVHEVKIKLNYDLDVPKIYTYFRQKMINEK